MALFREVAEGKIHEADWQNSSESKQDQVWSLKGILKMPYLFAEV